LYVYLFLYREFARVLRKPHDIPVSVRRRATITRFDKTEIKDKKNEYWHIGDTSSV